MEILKKKTADASIFLSAVLFAQNTHGEPRVLKKHWLII